LYIIVFTKTIFKKNFYEYCLFFYNKLEWLLLSKNYKGTVELGPKYQIMCIVVYLLMIKNKKNNIMCTYIKLSYIRYYINVINLTIRWIPINYNIQLNGMISS